MSHCRWNLLAPASVKITDPAYSPLLAQLLHNRGLTEAAQWSAYLTGDSRLAADPFLLPNMHQAVSRIYRALLSGESIAIYGDYDVDGVTATALLVQGLSQLGVKAIPYIPHRLTEGYGLTIFALEELHRQGISLVITADCGTTSHAEVKKAQRLGLDIIITDHHTPLAELPPATAVVNPKLSGSEYPFPELAGVGVAFKLLQALFQSLGKKEQPDNLLDLVALGTIADMSPLLGENRYLAKEGLQLINSHPRPGLRELMTQVRLDTGDLNTEKIYWIIAPCLNAAGRMAHALASYNLLMTEAPQEARGLATSLTEKNDERRKLTETNLAMAREKILKRGISNLLMTEDRDYHPGIAGLVASRLAEEFYRPAVVVKTGEKVSTGSCRSIPEFNIIAALNECSHLLSRFGGHSQAAGFTLPTRNLPRLAQQLSQLATERLAGIDLRPCLDIDVQVTLPELGGDTFQTTQLLSPFGHGNPVPTFISRRVEIVDCHPMGNGGEHLKLKLRQGKTVWDGVAFRLGDHLGEARSPLDIVYNLEIDHWGGTEMLRLNILDLAPAK